MSDTINRRSLRRIPDAPGVNYRLGTLYAVTTAFLFSVQEPFSSLAARRLSATQFVCATQVALLLSIPLLTLRTASRREFIALLLDFSNYGKFLALFIIGLSGLLFYKLGLSNAHPIIISAVLNLSPFWAALVALLISGKPIPVSAAIFFSCLAGAFFGAMAVAWSQIGGGARPSISELADNIVHGSWIYAVPIPVISALSGTLIGKWFAGRDESATIAANLLLSTSASIIVCVFILYQDSELHTDQIFAIVLMMIGTVVAAAAGRVFYQVSLTVTGNDNGYVTMFFLLVPALTSLVSLPLSLWIVDLHFVADPLFYFGLLLIAASLLLFSLKSWR
jgi:hypothetical protein